MIASFKDSDIQYSELPALNRGFLRKRGGRCTIHFSAEPSDAELLFRTITSANQLSIFGAVAECCDDLAQQIAGRSFSSFEKSIAKVTEQLNRRLAPEEVNIFDKST